jgi:hypothetical protein
MHKGDEWCLFLFLVEWPQLVSKASVVYIKIINSLYIEMKKKVFIYKLISNVVTIY